MLTLQQNSSMRYVTEIHDSTTRPYADPDDYNLPKIHSNDLDMWGRTYIQGMAALEPITMKAAIVCITRLRARKPTQNMNDSAVKLFIAMAAECLVRAEYSYFSVEQGIFDLLLGDESDFFPNDNTLRKYIYPVHYQLKKKMMLIGRMLEKS